MGGFSGGFNRWRLGVKNKSGRDSYRGKRQSKDIGSERKKTSNGADKIISGGRSLLEGRWEKNFGQKIGKIVLERTE